MIYKYFVVYNSDPTVTHELMVCSTEEDYFVLVDVKNALLFSGEFLNHEEIEKYLRIIGTIKNKECI